MFNNFFPPPPKQNLAIYEIMFKNVVEPDSPQVTMEMAHALYVLDN